MSFSRHQDGFSLIELMIAVAIITIVAAVGLPAYRSYVDTANTVSYTHLTLPTTPYV